MEIHWDVPEWRIDEREREREKTQSGVAGSTRRQIIEEKTACLCW